VAVGHGQEIVAEVFPGLLGSRAQVVGHLRAREAEEDDPAGLVEGLELAGDVVGADIEELGLSAGDEVEGGSLDRGFPGDGAVFVACLRGVLLMKRSWSSLLRILLKRTL
jgi:hypothetical protein